MYSAPLPNSKSMFGGIQTHHWSRLGLGLERGLGLGLELEPSGAVGSSSGGAGVFWSWLLAHVEEFTFLTVSAGLGHSDPRWPPGLTAAGPLIKLNQGYTKFTRLHGDMTSSGAP